jgi:hypothetical protein
MPEHQINRAFDPELIRPQDVSSIEMAQPFDPGAGTTVFSPPGTGSGWWVGAPSGYWDGSSFHLAFRTRRPQPERGGLY